MEHPDWIAVDWGTTHLRAWLMTGAGKVVAERRSDAGMSRLAPEAFAPALLALVGDVLDGDRVTPVICCGMAGSRQGWIEAPYVAAPCPPPGAAHAVRAPVADGRIDVRVLPGVKQTNPADVMRGEDTQIAGFLARSPDFDGVLCLPGTHTKWVRISAREIVGFRTYMTGELFSLLSGHSVLKHGLAGNGWSDPAFDDGLRDGLSRPESVAGMLFGLRAEYLLNGLEPAVGRARLSGLLIGVELAASRSYWLGHEVALVGEAALCDHYRAALAAQGVEPQIADGDQATLAGLAAAFAQLKETAR